MQRQFCDQRPEGAFCQKIALKISGTEHASEEGVGRGFQYIAG